MQLLARGSKWCQKKKKACFEDISVKSNVLERVIKIGNKKVKYSIVYSFVTYHI